MYFWLPQAHGDRIRSHGLMTMFVSSRHVIIAAVEGTLVGSDTKAPSGILSFLRLCDLCFCTVLGCVPRHSHCRSFALFLCLPFFLPSAGLFSRQAWLSLRCSSVPSAEPGCWPSSLLSFHHSHDTSAHWHRANSRGVGEKYEKERNKEKQVNGK